MIENTWLLLALIVGSASIAIAIAEKTKIGGKVGSPVIALFFGMVLTNLKITPIESPVHNVVSSYLISLAIPLLLFKASLKNVLRLGPKLLMAFSLGTIGSLLGGIVGALVVNIGPETWKAYAMFAATYIGGSVNLAAIGNGLNMNPSIWTAIAAADVIVFFLYTVILIAVGRMEFFKKQYKTSIEMGISLDVETVHGSSEKKEENIFGVATVFGCAIAVAALGSWIGRTVGISGVVFSTAFALFFAGTTKIGEMSNVDTLVGIWFMNIYMVVIGASAIFSEVMIAGPLMIIGATTVIAVHVVFVFIGGKLLKLPLDYLVVTSTANIGGPSTASSMAVACGWQHMVAPGVLAGILGYALGTYLGFGLAYFLKAIF